MLNAKEMGKSRTSIRKLVVIAMLSSISIFLGLSGLGFIVLPAFKLTIMHVPVIIGAILEGPVVGAAVGLMFGLFSMYQAVTAPTLTSFVLLNPLVSVLPRILIGIVAYYSYRALLKTIKKTKISIGISAILATFTNTVGVLGMTYILYLEKYAQALDISPSAVGTTLIGVASTNGLLESIASALITVPVIMGVLKIQRKR